MELTFGNTTQYRVLKKIGGGTFGELYLGQNLETGEQVAIKLESVKAAFSLLAHEAQVYRCVGNGLVGIPYASLRWFGVQHGYNALVLDLLGPSLEDLFNLCGRRFSLKTVLLLSEQLLCRVEQLHSRGFLHRDIKPENFLVGLRGGESQVVHMIDFGLSKRYRDPLTQEHIGYVEKKTLTGTARYASLSTHRGIEQSRRDDLASVGYMLVYFMRGSLPWQGLKGETKQHRHEKIRALKESMPVDVLCQGLPTEFHFLLNYANELRFLDKPDYSLIRSRFRELFIRNAFAYDRIFDWTLPIRSHLPSLHHLPFSKSRKPRAAPPILPPIVSTPLPPKNSFSNKLGHIREVWDRK
ncbi:uncharacterized protein VP01_130g9 [Puccinia sorghi]|uniref:non-specific serine/threonine protein kinase n=1 Tax=Puccinia sorghi TaxID=27349 RepID=A0A0L6VMX2_9BASI|nr:uncharacterized protein VP01_130g9 [Puccinia sorghi]